MSTKTQDIEAYAAARKTFKAVAASSANTVAIELAWRAREHARIAAELHFTIDELQEMGAPECRS